VQVWIELLRNLRLGWLRAPYVTTVTVVEIAIAVVWRACACAEGCLMFNLFVRRAASVDVWAAVVPRTAILAVPKSRVHIAVRDADRGLLAPGWLQTSPD
jgi:hypothetical protein